MSGLLEAAFWLLWLVIVAAAAGAVGEAVKETHDLFRRAKRGPRPRIE